MGLPMPSPLMFVKKSYLNELSVCVLVRVSILLVPQAPVLRPSWIVLRDPRPLYHRSRMTRPSLRPYTGNRGRRGVAAQFFSKRIREEVKDGRQLQHCFPLTKIEGMPDRQRAINETEIIDHNFLAPRHWSMRRVAVFQQVLQRDEVTLERDAGLRVINPGILRSIGVTYAWILQLNGIYHFVEIGAAELAPQSLFTTRLQVKQQQSRGNNQN